jgi:hypothetical protein
MKIVILATLCVLFSACTSNGLKKLEVDQISTKLAESKAKTFDDFLVDVSTQKLPKITGTAISLYRVKSKLSKDQSKEIYRLLGLYNRLIHKKNILTLLERMVAIPTFKTSRPQYKNPQIIKFGKLLKTVAGELNLTYRNVDNRVFEFILEGSSAEAFGIYTHAGR